MDEVECPCMICISHLGEHALQQLHQRGGAHTVHEEIAVVNT